MQDMTDQILADFLQSMAVTGITDPDELEAQATTRGITLAVAPTPVAPAPVASVADTK